MASAYVAPNARYATASGRCGRERKGVATWPAAATSVLFTLNLPQYAFL